MTVRAQVDPEVYRSSLLAIARKKLGGSTVQDIRIDDDLDLDGANCLRITVILKSHSILRSKGDKLSELSLEIKEFLDLKADGRFPYVHYATKAEMEETATAHD